MELTNYDSDLNSKSSPVTKCVTLGEPLLPASQIAGEGWTDSAPCPTLGSSYKLCCLFSPRLTPPGHLFLLSMKSLQPRKSESKGEGPSRDQTGSTIPLRQGCRKISVWGTSLVVQWLTLLTPNTGGLGSIPDRGTRSHVRQLRLGMAKQILKKNLQKSPL